MQRRCWVSALVSVLIVAPGAARADCFDVYGCTDKDLFRLKDIYETEITCDFLYQIRNGIYKTHGYCFHTPRAISELGNDGCWIKDQSQVRLNRIEEANAATILRAETEKGCPK
jgi:YARHG domain